MPVINADASALIREAITHKEVIRSWLQPKLQRLADRLAKQGFLVRGQMDTGSCVSRLVNYRFDLHQVPLKVLPDLLSGGVVKVGAIKHNLRRGDRVVFTGQSPWKGGKVKVGDNQTVWIEDEKGTCKEYTYEQIETLEIVWIDA